jgi:hypothetical protein
MEAPFFLYAVSTIHFFNLRNFPFVYLGESFFFLANSTGGIFRAILFFEMSTMATILFVDSVFGL